MLKVKHQDLPEQLLQNIVDLAEQLRNMSETIFYYMESEAELDLDTVDDFRIQAGDMGDLTFELKYKIDMLIKPYRQQLHEEQTKMLQAWMEREQNDPDMDGRC